MTVANGRQFLSIPGPTNVPDVVLQAMMRPAVDIYTGPLVAMTDMLLQKLQQVFRTTGQTYIYAANGHGGWEAALSNVLSRGDLVLALESGRFAIGWAEMARKMGAATEILPGEWHRAVDPAQLEARLARDRAHTIKAVMVVQIDTASGVVNDIPAIRRAMDAARHPALLMVDCVASLGCMRFEMDAWGVDVAMAGSQKGLMAPPGLAFVAANARARAAHTTANMTTSYWDWTFREGPEHYQKYCGTPPEHLLFGLAAAFDLLFAEGLEAAWERHRLLAAATHAAIATWAEGEVVSFNVRDPAQRAASITNVRLAGFDSGRLTDYTREKCGVTLGLGIGGYEGRAFRVAHMGHTNAPMVIGTLGAIEMALRALDIPHGANGVGAAIASLAKAVPA